MIDLERIFGRAGGRSLRGATAVIAFASSWPRRAPADALRAELRGLGATLLAVSPRGALCVGPDDEPREFAAPAELWRACEVRPIERGGPALALLVVDPDGNVRARREADSAEDLEPLLLSLLRAAAAQLRAAPLSVSRRELLASSLAIAAAGVALHACASAGVKPDGAPAATDVPSGGEVDLVLLVNGDKRPLRVEPRVTLLDALRERLGLTGAKKGCDMGQCGACTVLLDGKRANSCLQLAVQCEGRAITTIEGLAKPDGALHPVQAAFLEHDAFQCGYCTPGQILSAVALLDEKKPESDDEIRERMSGNLCRCGAYANIVAAVRAASGRA